MRPLTTVLTLAFLLAFVPNGHVRDARAEVVDRHAYELASSSTTGVAPVSGRKYNYVVATECRFDERQATACSATLADSIATARPGLGKVVVFLYLEGMDPKGIAVAEVRTRDGEVPEGGPLLGSVAGCAYVRVVGAEPQSYFYSATPLADDNDRGLHIRGGGGRPNLLHGVYGGRCVMRLPNHSSVFTGW